MSKTTKDAPVVEIELENEAPTAEESAPKRDVEAEIDSLRSRIEEIERKQQVIIDGYQFAANEVRPLYGFGAVALIFDAIYKKLSG